MEFEIEIDVNNFNLDHSLNCGQVFRWKKEKDWWIGIVYDKILKIKQENNLLRVRTNLVDTNEDFIRNYFRLDDPLDNILSSIEKDDIISRSIISLKGLRLVRQDPWECTISFICATYKNIESIKKIISNICRNFGSKIEFEGDKYYTFPNPQKLVLSNGKLLETCGLGYRTKYVKKVSSSIFSDTSIFKDLKNAKYEDARNILLSYEDGEKKFIGVGPKVADCVLLFSLEKMSAFPIDTWIVRAIKEFYPQLFDEEILKSLDNKLINGSINNSIYRRISDVMRKYFGEFSGYAQEYLYHYIRLKNYHVIIN